MIEKKRLRYDDDDLPMVVGGGGDGGLIGLTGRNMAWVCNSITTAIITKTIIS